VIESQLTMRRKRLGSTIVLLFGLALVGLSAPNANAAGEKRTRRVGVPTPPAMQPDSMAATATPPRADTTGTSSESSRAGRRKPAAPVGDVVRFGQSFSIHEDEVVSGDVVLLGGDLKVEGEIQGGAVVLGGNIEIGRRAQIRGEAISVGGRVDAAPGANVRGGTVSLNFLPSPLLGGRDWQHAQRLGALLGDGLQVFLWTILSALGVAFGAAKLRRTMATIAQTPGRCVGLGILALTGGLFSVVMLIVLLALTLVGLPLALLLAVAALVFLAAAQVVGLTRLGAALASDARRGAHRGPGRAGLLRARVVGRDRARQHAACAGAAHVRGALEGAEGSGRGAEAYRAGHGDRGRRAGGDGPLRARGDRALGAGRARKQD